MNLSRTRTDCFHKDRPRVLHLSLNHVAASFHQLLCAQPYAPRYFLPAAIRRPDLAQTHSVARILMFLTPHQRHSHSTYLIINQTGTMDPGTALAAVSLALQLPDTVRTIASFFRSIRDGPRELAALIETLEQAQEILEQVRMLSIQLSTAQQLESLTMLLNALGLFENKLNTLSKMVQDVREGQRSGKRLKRTWVRLNTGTKTARLRDLDGQLRNAMSGLHLAMSSNLMEMQY